MVKRRGPRKKDEEIANIILTLKQDESSKKRKVWFPVCSVNLALSYDSVKHIVEGDDDSKVNLVSFPGQKLSSTVKSFTKKRPAPLVIPSRGEPRPSFSDDDSGEGPPVKREDRKLDVPLSKLLDKEPKFSLDDDEPKRLVDEPKRVVDEPARVSLDSLPLQPEDEGDHHHHHKDETPSFV
mmetsp:Transcript_8181/g.26818  ORF Transcript_8181/g.26818 Transcript_8181/m.26818 type:complete len:181 (+) Transcript_8181:154-696(+)